MSQSFSFVIWLLFSSVLIACGVQAPATVEPTATIAEATPTPRTVTCADIDTNWGNDWSAVLDALEQLIALDQSCGPAR